MGDGEYLKSLAAILQAVAALGAVVILYVRYLRGSEVSNLSLTVKPERVRSSKPDMDWLALRITLKKGDRNMVVIHDAQARLSTHPDGPIPFVGLQRYAQRAKNGRYRVSWERDQGKPLVNLPPGDEMQLALSVEIPAAEPCFIEVVVLGYHYRQAVGAGQWQASDVSLPLTPQPVACSEPAPV